MGTSLTPEFWTTFAVLLVAAMGVTFVATATLDALAVRLLRRHVHRAPTAALSRSADADDRVTVRHRGAVSRGPRCV
ncbi:hypothetical protein OHB54_07285 [Streptomyces sp. NBC_01007]|nr:hypothetical protein OHB54_07285 [Streptomyces sp. NBC_01007]